MELLSRAILQALEAYESQHLSGPTVPELAADLGIPPDFGHEHLVARLERQVVLGRLSHHNGYFRLTEAGREALGREAGAPVSTP